MQYLIALHPQEVAMIGDALGKQPYERVVGLIQNIQAQISHQEKVAQNGSDISNVPTSPEASGPDEQPTAA